MHITHAKALRVKVLIKGGACGGICADVKPPSLVRAHERSLLAVAGWARVCARSTGIKRTFEQYDHHDY